jgi:peptide/nickel transport system substrate-binding protein
VATTRRALPITIVLAAILAVALIGWRAMRPARPAAPDTPAATAPSRGGSLIASIRSEPVTYNRYVDNKAAGDVLALLTQAPLVRVNRTTDELEPWLAERWTTSADGLTYTVTLRPGILFSDGTPLTSADVVFSFRAMYDPKVDSVLGPDARVAGKPLAIEAPDPSTVVIRFPAPFAPGLRLIDSLPILPKHKLEGALERGAFNDAWNVKTAPSDLAGLGPFVLREHVPGERLVFDRNPRYWRKDAAGIALPYLDSLTLLVIPDQNTEALRMQAGETDLMSNGDIRPDDYVTFKRVGEQGRLRLIDVGVGLDPNLLWFNLTAKHASDPRNAWLRQKAFRQAISCAGDRQAIANAVYLGAAVPIQGPVTPGNRTWFTELPGCDRDPAKARTLLASVGLTDKNGDGTLEDQTGAPARFSILTQKGHTIRERSVAVLQEQLRRVGLTVDVVALDPGAMAKRWQDGEYDTMYYGVQSSTTDPGLNPGFWLSSGIFHFWDPGQPSPATDWERRIDDLMRRQTAASSLAERKALFAEAQRTLAEEQPAIYFVAPRVTLAVSSRVANPQPANQIPQLLWSADTLAVSGARRTGS